MNNHRLTLLFVACSIFCSCGGGSSSSELTERIAAALKQYRSEMFWNIGLEVPGAAADICYYESDDLFVAEGKADIAQGTDIERESIFHVGSITKTFTAAWIMQLDQEGALSIDSPLADFVAFPNGGNITLRQLLSHTSGIRSFTEMPEFVQYYAEHPYPTPEEIIDFVVDYGRPDFPPGANYHYSNTNYYLLGMIGERVTGLAWQDELRRRFIEPLGLEHTYVYGYDEMPAGVTGYTVCADSDCTVFEMTPTGNDADWKLGWAAGALVSAAPDLAKWMHALIAGDVLDVAHREEMKTCTPQSQEVMAQDDPDGKLVGMGLGVLCLNSPSAGRGWGHDGIVTGFAAVAAEFPESGFSVGITVNTYEADSWLALERVLDAVAHAPFVSRLVPDDSSLAPGGRVYDSARLE